MLGGALKGGRSIFATFAHRRSATNACGGILEGNGVDLVSRKYQEVLSQEILEKVGGGG